MIIDPAKIIEMKLVTGTFKKATNGIDLVPETLYKIPDAVMFLRGKERKLVSAGSLLTMKKAADRRYPVGLDKIADHNKERIFPSLLLDDSLKDDDVISQEFWLIDPGTTVETIFSKVKIPADMVAFFLPRSTFNRLGALKVPTALFDSGFEGKPSQTCRFPCGAAIHVDEAWGQIVYLKSERIVEEQLYDGNYQEK
jgi:deoxycytidine triphosphate deaminase